MRRDKLDRFSEDITADAVSADNMAAIPQRYRLLADQLGGNLCTAEDGNYIKVVSDFKDTYAHGRHLIMDRDVHYEFRRRHFYYNQDEAIISSRQLLFFDIETTGLGGSGTVAFLIGCGSIVDGNFQIRQYFLPDYSDEAAMLAAVRNEFSENTVIVSYNGKAFDLPILTDRLIIQRVERNLTFQDHIDLLHIARRLYRRRLGDCTLTNMERQILDFHRIDDIPGYLVPSIYFAWLNYDETGNLKDVVRHNLFDIVSLFFLMHHVAEVQREPAERISAPEDILSLAKIIDSVGEYAEVHRFLETFENITDRSDCADILFLQGMACKRCGKIPEAAALFKKVAEIGTGESFPALVELAKFCEHKFKDYPAALAYSLRARKVCPPSQLLKNNLEKRISRLRSK